MCARVGVVPSSVVRRGPPSVGAPAWARARACAGRVYHYVLHDVTILLLVSLKCAPPHDICLPHTHHHSLTVTAVHTTYLLCPRTAHFRWQVGSRRSGSEAQNWRGCVRRSVSRSTLTDAYVHPTSTTLHIVREFEQNEHGTAEGVLAADDDGAASELIGRNSPARAPPACHAPGDVVLPA